MTQQAPPQEALACSQCGRMFAHSDLLQIAGNWVCGGCKPAFLSRLMAGGSGAIGWHYGGFWMRFGARIIDSFVLGVPVMILAAVLIPNLFRVRAAGQPPNLAFAAFGLTFIALAFLTGAFYEVLMLRYQSATVGKMACGLQVVRSDGRSLGWGVSFGRFFMWNVVTSGIPYLNFLLMLTSGIMAGVDEQKRALHDRVCDTRVIYKRSLA